MTDKDENGNGKNGENGKDKKPDEKPTEKKEGGEDKDRTFTQAEVDGIVQKRLARQGQKYEGHDDLKDKAAKYDKLVEDAKSDLQKAEDAKTAAEKERDAALQKAHDTLIRATFIAEGGKQGVANPELGDAYAIADLAGVKVEEGVVTGVDVAIKALIDDGRLPMAKKPDAPDLDGGAGNGDEDAVKKLTAEELEVAKKMGLTPEQYALSKASPTSAPAMDKLKPKDESKKD